jgi:small subunit ribosomal protein S6
VKKYEGLFILNMSGKEEGIKEAIDRIGTEITNSGGKVDTIQKMDKRPFVRIADKKYTSGFYVNFIFDMDPSKLEGLRHRFVLNDDVFRVLFSNAPAPKAAVEAR